VAGNLSQVLQLLERRNILKDDLQTGPAVCIGRQVEGALLRAPVQKEESPDPVDRGVPFILTRWENVKSRRGQLRAGYDVLEYTC